MYILLFQMVCLLMKKGEVDELKMPLKPDTLENPVERKIKKEWD